MFMHNGFITVFQLVNKYLNFLLVLLSNMVNIDKIQPTKTKSLWDPQHFKSVSGL